MPRRSGRYNLSHRVARSVISVTRPEAQARRLGYPLLQNLEMALKRSP